MAEIIPVNAVAIEQAQDSALAVHEALDNVAHQEIAQTEDEDYKWLTDRLDVLSSEVGTLRNLYETRVSALEQMFQANQEQSRTLINAQTELIQTLTSNLAAMNESVLSKLIQPNSRSESQPTEETTPTETVTEAVTEVQPGGESTHVETSAPTKKRARI